VVTRTFTGHPARALANRFIDAYADLAPVAYPAVDHLTAPIRAAAARSGDIESLSLWASTGFAYLEWGAAQQILDDLDPRT
jgi:nitronate monooxygenase